MAFSTVASMVERKVAAAVDELVVETELSAVVLKVVMTEVLAVDYLEL